MVAQPLTTHATDFSQRLISAFEMANLKSCVQSAELGVRCSVRGDEFRVRL